MIAASFLFFLLAFLGIGIGSVLKSHRTPEDYLVADKSVPAWLAGLSAVATNNSGFMFIGMIGLTYATGLSSIWLMIGWILGDLAVSLMTLKRLVTASRSERVRRNGNRPDSPRAAAADAASKRAGSRQPRRRPAASATTTRRRPARTGRPCARRDDGRRR